jgi:hypothetical protein
VAIIRGGHNRRLGFMAVLLVFAGIAILFLT